MDPESSNVIVLHNVNKRCGRTAVLQNMSMEVPRSAVFGLYGPADAGKTVVLRLIAGLDQVDRGSIEVDGFDSWHDKSILRYRLAYMPQRFGRYPYLTVEEYLALFQGSFNVPAGLQGQLTDELLELIDLGHRRKALVGDLSDDEQQWLGLSRCLIHDPDILLLDDPLATMTPAIRPALFDMLTEMRKLGKTVVITSRRSLEIQEVCTRLGMIRDGMVVHEGAIDEVNVP